MAGSAITNFIKCTRKGTFFNVNVQKRMGYCGQMNTQNCYYCLISSCYRTREGGSDLRLVLTLLIAACAACEWALRKARAERCSSLKWTLLPLFSDISSSLISCSWRSCWNHKTWVLSDQLFMTRDRYPVSRPHFIFTHYSTQMP